MVVTATARKQNTWLEQRAIFVHLGGFYFMSRPRRRFTHFPARVLAPKGLFYPSHALRFLPGADGCG